MAREYTKEGKRMKKKDKKAILKGQIKFLNQKREKFDW